MWRQRLIESGHLDKVSSRNRVEERDCLATT
jgi:hypothetical protein